MADLLLGCGSSLQRQIPWGGRSTWTDLTRLDINPDHKPDVVWDIEKLPLPFAGNSFDEIHAYHVLEHVGRQGDYRFFFDQWADFWRILKPGGIFCGVCPHRTGAWAWGDPGHTRTIARESLVFLTQPEYTAQVGATPLTDYRFVYRADFDLLAADDTSSPEHFVFALKAVKPSRISFVREDAA